MVRATLTRLFEIDASLEGLTFAAFEPLSEPEPEPIAELGTSTVVVVGREPEPELSKPVLEIGDVLLTAEDDWCIGPVRGIPVETKVVEATVEVVPVDNTSVLLFDNIEEDCLLTGTLLYDCEDACSWEEVEDLLGVLEDIMELEDVVADENVKEEDSTCEMVEVVDPSGP